LKSRRDRWL